MAKREKIKKKLKLNIKKPSLDKLVDICAEVIYAWDEFAEIWDEGMSALWALIITCGAAVINGADKGLDALDKVFLFIGYHVAKATHDFLGLVHTHRKMIVSYGASLLLIVLCLLALLNYATGYEYSYKGKVLGVVKDQDNVLKIVDLVSENLTKEYKTDIKIDAEEDIQFRKIFTLDKQVDGIDQVLARLSNMSDTRAQSYAIRINGKNKYYLDTKEDAQWVLQKIKNYYIPPKKQKKYESVKFVEKVKIVPTDTIIGNLRSAKSVYKSILKGKKGEGYYTVKSGETVSEICSKLDVSMKQMKKMNPKLNPELIHEGQKIVVSRAVPMLSVKTIGIETYKKKIGYKTIYKKSSSIYQGDSSVARAGSYGVKSITSRVVRKNGDKLKEKVLKTKILRKPVNKIVLKGTKQRPPSVGDGHFRWPVPGSRVTSYFGYRWGRMHEGIDMACGTGTPIYAADGGVVEVAGWHWGYGLCIIVNHQNGYKTLYGHCSSLNVSVGSKVYKGERIGAVGNTGNSYGSHCHFEIRKNGVHVNPLSYI